MRFTKDLDIDSLKISVQDLKARSFEDLDARNGMNLAPRSSRDLTARFFENQLMGKCSQTFARRVLVNSVFPDRLVKLRMDRIVGN